MKKKITDPDLLALRQILEEKFFYKTADFDGRTEILNLGDGDESKRENALCFEVFAGAPFILFVLSDTEPTKAFRELAFNFALQTETIGTVAFFIKEAENFQTFRGCLKSRKNACY